jgi:hypothetical protein
VQERDGLGDRLPSDYLIRVQEGGCAGRGFDHILKKCLEEVGNFRGHTLSRLLSELVPGRAYASDFPDLGYFDKAAA